MGGKTQFPDNSRAEVLAKNLAAGNWRGSLGGCVIERLGDVIYIWREYRGAGPKPVDASSGAIWDGRWRLKPQAATPESRIVALGRDGELAPCREEIGLPRRIRRAASAALPVLVTGGEADKDKPAKFDPGPFLQVLAPWREFLPCFDLDLAMSMEKLLCGEGLPEIPVGLKKLLPI
jgi:tRNA(Ile)-lysidine synthase